MTVPHLDLDPDRALPAAAYRDPAWLAAEKERIWHGDWVFAATKTPSRRPETSFPW